MRIMEKMQEAFEKLIRMIEDFLTNARNALNDLTEELAGAESAHGRAQPVKRQRPGRTAHGHTAMRCHACRKRRYTAATGT